MRTTTPAGSYCRPPRAPGGRSARAPLPGFPPRRLPAPRTPSPNIDLQVALKMTTSPYFPPLPPLPHPGPPAPPVQPGLRHKMNKK